MVFLLPVAGILCFTFGASLLPALLARLATSHYLYVLPYGRAKLLASAFATVALTALFAACIVTMYYYQMPFALELVFQRALAVSFVTASFLYVVLWLTGKGGNIGLLVGAFVTDRNARAAAALHRVAVDLAGHPVDDLCRCCGLSSRRASCLRRA